LATEFGLEPDAIAAKITDYFHAKLIAKPDFEMGYKFQLLKPASTAVYQNPKLSNLLFTELKDNSPLSRDRGEKLNALFRGRECYAAALSHYFGTRLPNGMVRCNQCTWCTTRIALMPRERPFYG
jgi:hypothetical protein